MTSTRRSRSSKSQSQEATSGRKKRNDSAKIQACPVCGSPDLSWVGGGTSAVFDFTGATALSGLRHCNNCGRDINPIELNSKKEYKKFAAAIRKKPPQKLKAYPQDPGVKLSSGLLSILGAFFFALLSLACFVFLVATGFSFPLFLFASGFAVLAYFFYSRKT